MSGFDLGRVPRKSLGGGLSKVNSPARQWFSKVEIVFNGAFE